MGNCNRCEDLEHYIRRIFKATGYMDLYGNDISMMASVIIQGIKKDQRLIKMLKEAGEKAVEALDFDKIVLIPNSTQGHFK